MLYLFHYKDRVFFSLICALRIVIFWERNLSLNSHVKEMRNETERDREKRDK